MPRLVCGLALLLRRDEETLSSGICESGGLEVRVLSLWCRDERVERCERLDDATDSVSSRACIKF